MLFIGGLLIFSHQLLVRVEQSVIATWLSLDVLRMTYWSALGFVVLIPLFAVWRNLSALAAIAADAWQVRALPSRFIETSLKITAAIALGSFLYALFPVKLSAIGWGILAVATFAVIAMFSRKLIYWHSTWQHSVNEVLAGHGYAAGPEGGADLEALAHHLDTWEMQLRECTVPAGATYVGQSLAELQTPARFGCFVVEIQRNNFAITQPPPDLN